MICLDCFKEYAKVAIESGIKSVTTTCPGGCDLIITKSDYVKLCTFKEVEKYNGFFVTQII